jgi:type I restriction enzyme M protein
MLDTITKKRIDDCRDILVGKLPDPKAQIEQITIGLIYKFMDDMDKEAIELGGKAKFFSDYTILDPEDENKEITIPFSNYSWDRLFDAKVTASEMLRLYSEAIESMEKNPNIPQLFRDIFNNAYLPYRDPETLKLFLKTIGEFEYTHSEKLGDAFEYLLSVMGSQGDAGQFRTPRHIIDFLVAIVDPSKTDTIMDPACGTAGFLISAFKYLKQKNNNQFTPDEQKKIIKNFVGYDISPDMVRLSLVNLYLHGFTEPHIFEYDTLSSEERWNENFDVILANPPFMSPKGGIRPHKKYTISSNRSEVLFVDYIAEHLNPKGKAGIIVPEGIIFQSGTAYKDIRKMLVDNYLYSVISLPAGVFNPYSGVKTSILLFDSALAKKSKEVLFIKIDNDGYSLGSQRGEVKGGQLEEAIQTAKVFKQSILDGEEFKNTTIAHSVDKKDIAKNGDFNLSGERYKVQNIDSRDFLLSTLEELVEVKGGKRLPKGSSYSEEKTAFPYIRVADFNDNGIALGSIKYISTEIQSQISNYIINKADVYISIAGTIGSVGIIPDELDGANLTENAAKLVIKDKNQINQNYLALMLKDKKSKNQIKAFTHSVGVPKLAIKRIKQIQIPLPPLSIQEKIVSEIEGYQKIIDGAKMVANNYKPKIDIDTEWEMIILSDVCKMKGGYAFKSSDYVDEGSTVIRMGNVKSMQFDYLNNPKYLPKSYLETNKSYVLKKGDILISMTGTVGKEDYGNVCMVDVEGDFLLNQRVGKFEITNANLDKDFLYLCANQDWFRKQIFKNSSGGVRQSNISNKGIEAIEIPFPAIDIQRQIVTQIENEQILVNSNKELIEIFKQKIKDRIAKVWGE